VPVELGANAGRGHVSLPEDLCDCCRRDSLTDACEFTDDPLVNYVPDANLLSMRAR
jgi:hypothetical protein